MEANNKMKLCAAIACLTFTGVAVCVVLNQNEPVNNTVLPVFAQHAVVNCGQYSTNIENNISHEDVLSTVPEQDNYSNFDGTTAASLSDIVDSMTATKGQFYHQETGKTGYESWKFGTGSAAGSLTITLNQNINAVGFYAVAYANTNDIGKKLKVNNTVIDQPLIAAEAFDMDNDDQRFFVTFDTPVSEVTIAAETAKNNRFYLYSIGFYTLNLN